MKKEKSYKEYYLVVDEDNPIQGDKLEHEDTIITSTLFGEKETKVRVYSRDITPVKIKITVHAIVKRHELRDLKKRKYIYVRKDDVKNWKISVKETQRI